MLLLFSRSGALLLSLIGDRLQVHPTSVTNPVDRLEDQGLVERIPHSTYRRTKLARLTDTGRVRGLEATGRLNATVFVDPGLTRLEVHRLVHLLRRLQQRAGDF